MKIHSAQIRQVHSRLGLQSLTLQLEGSLSFTPGQYLAANLADDTLAVLPEILFIEKIAGHQMTICPAKLDGWHPGKTVIFRGPLGKGMDIPQFAKRLAIISLDDNPARVLSLAAFGLEKQMDVVMVGGWVTEKALTADIAPSIELAPLTQITELALWADYLLLDVPHARLGEIEKMVQTVPALLRPGFAQVLVAADMPCAGIADCGICAVKTRRGYKLSCHDGPVFQLGELIY